MKSLAFALLSLLVTTSALADKVAAREAYSRGVKQYNLGEYQYALDAFTTAYNEFPDPILLFNLAQCHRQLGSKQKAITLYRSFLRETNGATANGEEVRRIVAVLEQEIANEQATKRTPPTGVATPEPAVSDLPPVE